MLQNVNLTSTSVLITKWLNDPSKAPDTTLPIKIAVVGPMSDFYSPIGVLNRMMSVSLLLTDGTIIKDWFIYPLDLFEHPLCDCNFVGLTLKKAEAFVMYKAVNQF